MTVNVLCRLVRAWMPRRLSASEYVAIEVRLPYDEAKASCESYNAHLASVSSQDEQDFLIDMLDK